MTAPKVTVIMSVYNSERYVRDALESILQQTSGDFELLIINDGSTDRTKEILQSYDDARLRVVENATNIGLSKSLNIGLRLANGEYIARLDADDISLPDRIERQAQYLDEHPEVGLIVSGVNVINEKGELVSTYLCNLSSEEFYYKLIFSNCIFHSSVMFRKSTIVELGGYDESLKRSQDYDLWCKISDVTRIDCISEPLIKWRDLKTNISTVNKLEQDTAAYLIFSRNANKLMDGHVEVDKIRSFHDEAFSDRPVIVHYNTLLELARIQRRLVENCPPWLDKEKLAAFCERRLQYYLRDMFIKRQFADLMPVLRDARFRQQFFATLKKVASRSA